MKALILAAVILGIAAGFVAAQQEPPKDGAVACEHFPRDKKAKPCDCPGMHRDPMCKTPDDPNEPEPSYEESSKCTNHCKKELCGCLRACNT